MRSFTTCVFTLCAALAAPTHGSSFDAVDPGEGSIPVVLTPTRLRQSLSEVPASVTVITADMLRKYGIRNIPEALRLVPGMAVAQVTGNDFRINYHGTNILVPRRMNVLIDGVSVYRPAFARVDWKEMPVAIEDVERIEVTRGPNSASYGANSMMAIINIITKLPKEVEGVTLATTIGTQQTAAGLARYSGKVGPSTSYRVTVERQHDHGFDFANSFGRGHDSTRLNKLNISSVTEISGTESFTLQGAVVEGLKEIEYIERYQSTFPDIRLTDYYLNGKWNKELSTHHNLQIQGYITQHRVDQPWRTCLPTAMLLPQMYDLWRANPNYANALIAGRMPSGGTAQDNALAAAALAAFRALGARGAVPTCVDANQNYQERRVDLELQDTFVFSDKLRMVNGVGWREDRGESETFLAGVQKNQSTRAFTNLEYKPYESLVINAGGFLESDGFVGTNFSPRLALNTHLNSNNTLRFVVSQANRMPNIEEMRANWSYRTTNYSPPLNGTTEGYFFQSARSNQALGREKILSKEIGYFGNFQDLGVQFDAKLFHDQLTQLISEKLQLTSYLPTNRNSVRLQGAELQLSCNPSDRWSAHAAYTYLDNDASISFESSQYSKHTGALALSHLLANQWRTSAALYHYSGNANSQSSYGRQDIVVSKTFTLGKDQTLTPTLTIAHLTNKASTFAVDVGQRRESRYNDSMQYYFSLVYTH